jgi:hypothetical protein
LLIESFPVTDLDDRNDGHLFLVLFRLVHAELQSGLPGPDPVLPGQVLAQPLGAAHVRPIPKALENLLDAKLDLRRELVELFLGLPGDQNPDLRPRFILLLMTYMSSQEL